LDRKVRILKLTLAYDGGAFVGWQQQAQGVSIQGLIEAALTRITGVETRVTGAGRTDAGVHALGQVASARISGDQPIAELWRALNALLPPDIRVVGVDEAPVDFHARFAARGKRYAYRLATGAVLSPFERRYAWHVTHPLETAAMSAALDALVGTHDFAVFQAAGSAVPDTVRTLFEVSLLTSASAALTGPALSGPPLTGLWGASAAVTPGLVVMLRGDGFLRHMVRNIVGTLVEVGRGRRSSASMATLLDSRDRRLAGPTAPPEGLFLIEVEY
jgi:tRNA pseudouridine38-40 synthase